MGSEGRGVSFKPQLLELVLFAGAMGRMTAVSIAGRTPTVWYADVALALATLICLRRQFPSEQLRNRRTQSVILCMAFYLAVNCGTMVLSVDPLYSLAVLKLLTAPLLAFFVGITVFRTEQSAEHFLDTLSLFGAMVGVMLILGWRDLVLGAATPEAEGIKEMAQSSLGRNNAVASLLVFLMPIGLRTVLSKRSLLWLPAALCLAIMGAALALTISRGASICLAFGLCVTVLLGVRGGGRNIRRLAVLGSLLFVVLTATVPEDIWTNWQAVFDRLADSVHQEGNRIDKLLMAWPFVRENPLWGIGVGNQRYLVYEEGSSHNILMDALLETGALGLAFLATTLASLALASLELWKGARTPEARLRAASLLGAFSTGILNALEEPTFFCLPLYAYTFWFTMAACLTLHRLQGRRALTLRTAAL